MLTQSATPQSTILRSGTVASLPFIQEVISLCYDLRWLMLLCAALVIVDFKFGIERAIYTKEPIRYSNAWRRTINKAADYVCWILLGGILGKAMAVPFGISPEVVAAIVVLIASVIEIDSIIQNYFEARGVHGMSLRVLVGSWLRITHHDDVADALHDETKDIHKD